MLAGINLRATYGGYMKSDGSNGSGWILPLVLGAVTGAFAASIFLSWLGDLTPNGVEYTDLAAVLLTAAGVIVTSLGVAFGLAAFWGFGEVRRSAVASAEVAAINEAKEQIENGALRDYIRQAVIDEIESPEMDVRIGRRVDEVSMGNPDKDGELDMENGDQ